jgi:SAM-dependent methyltransferase
VRDRYASAARAVDAGITPSCGGGFSEADFGATRYDGADRGALPAAAVAASLGCGNPVAVAELRPGETVLDLSSGGGIDVILSARRVGLAGYAFGVDMTDEMLDLVRRNAIEAGIDNVEFLKGQIEEVPLPDARVDVVISNCVINLSVNKTAMFAEAFRVLRPGGVFAGSDSQPSLRWRLIHLFDTMVVVDPRTLPERLRAAGFAEAEVEVRDSLRFRARKR